MRLIRWWKRFWQPMTYAEETMKFGTASITQQVLGKDYLGPNSGTEKTINRIKREGENK